MYSQGVQPLICKWADRIELGMSSPLRPDSAIGNKNITAKNVGSVTRRNDMTFSKYEANSSDSSRTEKILLGYSTLHEQRELKLPNL
jgi:hypothetical protein